MGLKLVRKLSIQCIKEMHIGTAEYDSIIKHNEIMPFPATWMQLEIII